MKLTTLNLLYLIISLIVFFSHQTRTEVFVRMALHPSLASVLVDFQGNYVNGNHPFAPIVLQERYV